jgi:Na+/phosphate symporter
MAISPFALLIAVAGLLIYAFATNTKISEIGRIMFGCGLFVFVWLLGAQVFRL